MTYCGSDSDLVDLQEAHGLIALFIVMDAVYPHAISITGLIRCSTASESERPVLSKLCYA